MAKVTIVDYDPSWPGTFERIRSNIWPHIRDVVTSLEHIGSTSVPGLPAKPVIDMTVIVPNPTAMKAVIDRLGKIGYRHRGDLGIPGRETFARPEGTPDHHLYACLTGNDGLRNHLTLRAHLRAHPEAVEEYGRLKRELAERFPDDTDAYIEGKTGFILAILAEAGFTDNQRSAIRAANRKP